MVCDCVDLDTKDVVGHDREGIMDVSLSEEESIMVQRALRSYLSDLRMEIVDTDNPQYRRDLRDERAALESALAKLDGTAAEAVGLGSGQVTKLVQIWWSTSSDS
jgi:hypothetical protein